MAHPHRHRSPFHFRRGPGAPTPAPVPLVIVDGPSPLGTAASTFVALGLLGSSPSVAMIPVAELHPPRRSRALPGLDELAASLAARLEGAGPVDLVGVGLGAIVALRLALDGGPIRRVVAIDAPVPAYRASELLAAERYWGVPPRSGALSGSSGGRFGSGGLPALLEGAVPDTIDTAWIRRTHEHHPAFGRPVSVLAIPDPQLARITQPVLCINSPRADVVTGGDHIARLVPTTQLLRLRTTDLGDFAEQARVSEALHEFLDADLPAGPAYRPAPVAVTGEHDVIVLDGHDGHDGVIDLDRLEAHGSHGHPVAFPVP